MILSSLRPNISSVERREAKFAKAANAPEGQAPDAVELSANPAARESQAMSAAKLKASPSPEATAASLAQTAAQTANQAATAAVAGPAAVLLRVLSLNTYFDSKAGVDTIADLITTTKADLVGLQEVNQTTKALAEKLGMHYVQQDKRTALLSRYPIESVTPKKFGVAVTLDNGQKVGFLNVHATSFPNQPHQLLHLPQGGGPYINTEKEAIWWADKTRGREFRSMVSEADAMGHPSIAVGDFNEPSHLDWTEATAAIKRHPIKVEWPGSKTFEKAGFKDSYRVQHPDPVTHPGNTWTPTTQPDDPNDHHDRIDFVMYRGEQLKLVSSQVVGENTKNADIVIDPWPTDHRAVLATFEVSPGA
jgi:endonuclease/exonuclease/phosphatase family metal-dependent hydrolase